MTKSQAETIAEIYDGKIREDYSGRCMYGKTTFGVVVDRYAFSDFLASRRGKSGKYRTDNMGLSYIIY